MPNKNTPRPEIRKHYILLIELVNAANANPFPDRFSVPLEARESGPRGGTYSGTAAYFPYIRESLRALAAHPGGARPWKSGELFESSTVVLSAPWTGQAALLTGPQVRIDALNGAITRLGNFYDDVFMRAIEGFSVNRLGICPICDKLFIAFRYDQRTCSARCGNVLRVRESRSAETTSRNPPQTAPVQPKSEPEDPDELFSCPECGEQVKRIDTRHDARGRRLCKKCFDSWFSEAEREAERISKAAAKKRATAARPRGRKR